MERIYEFLSENADFGYRVYIANDNSIYMSFEAESTSKVVGKPTLLPIALNINMYASDGTAMMKMI